MQLTILFDHRFRLDEDGRILSAKNYSAEFFASRYLRVFDRIRLVARLTTPNGSLPGLHPFPDDSRIMLRSVGDWQSAFGWLRRQAQIRSIVRQEAADAEAVLAIVPGVLAGMAFPELRRRDYSIEVVGDPYDSLSPGTIRHPLRPIVRMLAPRSLRRLCRHATHSSYVTSTALQKRYPPGPTTTAIGCSDVVLPNEAFRQAAPSFQDTSTRPITLINVGTMAVNYKRQDLLIRAVAALRNRGREVMLRLVGDGALRADFAALAKMLRVEEFVTFCGSVAPGQEIREELDGADLFVMPSVQEGLPRALVEAMARGLPCLASRVGGIPELLSDGDLFAPRSAETLISAIDQMIADPRRMSQAAARNLTKAAEFRSNVLDSRRLEFYESISQAAKKQQSATRRAA
ncbi:MAG: glycosyltransferase family 4 protein [Planctomycetaceae bacterium]|nr:glycosyltransferase family 4 protein [Planctomycetaceae bacterium]